MRDAYRRELDCQIVHDSYHERGFVDSYTLSVDDHVVGYGSIAGPQGARDTVKEFYVSPEWRSQTQPLFQSHLDRTHAKAIEAQSNDPLLTPLLSAYSTEITSDTILFAEGVTTDLAAPGAILRKIRWYQRSSIFPHTVEPVGDWGLEYEGKIVATGGLLCHYNPPYGDIYMEVAEAYRRRGFGSFLVQELKRIGREGGHTPAARCNVDNTASQRTLERAGMAPCGRILRGLVRV